MGLKGHSRRVIDGSLFGPQSLARALHPHPARLPWRLCSVSTSVLGPVLQVRRSPHAGTQGPLSISCPEGDAGDTGMGHNEKPGRHLRGEMSLGTA